jgi:hypothetical protein
MPETKPKTKKDTQAAKVKAPAVDEAPVNAPKQPVEAAKPKKAGKPTTYNEHIALVICIRIAEGESLRQILKDDGMPAQSTVYEWLLRHTGFAEHYARARDEQADTLADEIIQIADEQPEIVVVTDKKTGAVIEHKLDGAFLQWQKNRIDARKWTAMKLKPKKYGDRLAMEGVEGGAPIVTEETSSSRILEMIKNLEMNKRAS